MNNIKLIINNNILTNIEYIDSHENNIEQTLIIPEGIEEIAIGAIKQLAGLIIKEIIFPSTFKTLHNGSIDRVNFLESIIVKNGCDSLIVKNNCLYSSDYKTLYLCLKNATGTINVVDGCNTICQSAFSFCNKLEKIILPDSIEFIYKEAFAYCSIKEIELPNSLKVLEELAFVGCENLNKLSLPNTLTSIKMNTFSGCKNLKELYIPKSIKYIEYAYDTIPKHIKLIFHSGSPAKDYALKKSMIFEELLY